MLWRIWRAWSTAAPPPELQWLLDLVAAGYSLQPAALPPLLTNYREGSRLRWRV